MRKYRKYTVMFAAVLSVSVRLDFTLVSLQSQGEIIDGIGVLLIKNHSALAQSIQGRNLLKKNVSDVDWHNTHKEKHDACHTWESEYSNMPFFKKQGKAKWPDIAYQLFLLVRSTFFPVSAFEWIGSRTVTEDVSRTYGSERNWMLELSNNIWSAIWSPSKNPMLIKYQLDSSEMPTLELTMQQLGDWVNGTAQLIFKAPLKMIFCCSFATTRMPPVAIFCLAALNSDLQPPSS